MLQVSLYLSGVFHYCYFFVVFFIPFVCLVTFLELPLQCTMDHSVMWVCMNLWWEVGWMLLLWCAALAAGGVPCFAAPSGR